LTDDLSRYYEQSTSGQGLSTAAKVGIGCAATLLLMIVLVGVTAYFAWSWYGAESGRLDEFAVEFEQQGYRRMDGRWIGITQPTTGPLIIRTHSLEIAEEVDGDLAVAAEFATIKSTVYGDLDFYGNVLIIEAGAVITGDVRVRRADVVTVHGTIQGELTGTWEVLAELDLDQHMRQGQSPIGPDTD
jgi:hypothetical protein